MGYVYMTAALVCWTGLAFSYRWAERTKVTRFFMSATVGCMAAFWALLVVLLGGIDLTRAHISQVIVGCVAGAAFTVNIPVFLAAVSRGDISITWMVLTLSFAPTSLIMMVYPGEHPTGLGITGLALAVAAVILLGLDMLERHRTNHPRKPRKGWGFFMSIAYVLNALTQYSFKLADWLQPEKHIVHKLAYMLSLYAVVTVGSLLLVLLIPRRGSVRRAIPTGALIGTLLLFGGLFVLQALSPGNVPGYIIFPATAGGSSILVVVLSVMLLKERPGRFGWTGIAVGAVALTLLGLAA